MLFLNQKDLQDAVTRNEIVDSVEQAMRMYEERNFHMPDRMHVDYQGNTLLLMPCFTKESMGTKLVSLYPENDKKGLPVLYGVMVLNDGKTGKPLAVMDGSALTALRTGAVGSVSLRYMTSENVKTLGVVGAGVQGFNQTLTACTQRKFKRVYVYDRFPEKASQLKEKLLKRLKDVRVIKPKNVEELLKNSEVVITATTSMKPVLPDDEKLLQGKHIVGIGSYKPDMREFPKALFENIGTLAVDTDHAVRESGDLKVPLEKGWIQRDQIITLGKMIIGETPIDHKGSSTTIFKSVGMALFDLKVSELIYQKAREKGLGQKVDF